MARVRRDYSSIKVNDTFGLWTVLGAVIKRTDWVVPVRCRCGREKEVRALHLLKGASTGCGCTRLQRMAAAVRTHGESKTRLYRVWKGMRERCSNPKHKGYYSYGGRGIKVCAEWQVYETFAAWAMANGYRGGLDLDRRDNNGNYEPDNCRFVTPQVNSNNRRWNRRITLFGETKTMAEWGRDSRCAPGYNVFRHRIEKRWNPLRALTTPLIDPAEGEKVRGSQVNTARLTEADIPVIRARIAAGEKQGVIARDYGVARVTINHLACGRAWRHVE